MAEIRMLETAASAVSIPPANYASLFIVSDTQFGIKDYLGNVNYFGVSSVSLASYASASALPALGVLNGSLAVVLDTNILYEYNGSTWLVLANPYLTTVNANVGTRASPILVASSGVPFSSGSIFTTMYIAGNGSPISVTGNPQIAAASTLGQKLSVIFTDDTNTVNFTNGNGLNLNGPIVGNTDKSLSLEWDGTSWFETWRRG